MHSVAAAIVASLVLAPAVAWGGDPFEIQVYDGTANAPGVPGLELHVNDWATGRRVGDSSARPLHGQFHATLEPSLGVTPFWEVGAYLQSAVRTDDGVVDWAGVKLRSKFVTPPGWSSRWRLGLNLELAYVPSPYDPNRWGAEMRPIVSWQDAEWLFAFNPILDQPLAGSDAANGPSFEPALKVARTVGTVAVGLEYYGTLGPLVSPLPWREQDHLLFEAIDVVGVERLELNAAIGEGLTPSSAGIVAKFIVGIEFEQPATRAPPTASNRTRMFR